MYNHKLREGPTVKRQIIDLITKRFFSKELSRGATRQAC